MKKVFCKDRIEWRNWLELNHNSLNEIWLVYYKKHTKKPTVTYNEAVEEALCFGWIDSTIRRIDEETYMQKYTPRNDNSVWSLANKKRIEKLIKEGKITEAGIGKVEKAKANGQWQKAHALSKQLKMPEDLEKTLKENKMAWINFKNFAPSYRNTYIGWVMAAKRPETIAKRIKLVVERSEQNEKPGML